MLRDEPIRSKAVATLEDLTVGARVVGVRPDGPVSVVAVKWLGTTAIELTYKDSAGRVANEPLFRDRESSLEIVSAGRAWNFDVLVREGGKGLARQEGVSFRTLRRRFKDRGMTISEARLTRQASMVVNLLQLKDVTLRDVALRLGYSGVPALTKFVRREFGVPPGNLRRQLQGQ